MYFKNLVLHDIATNEDTSGDYIISKSKLSYLLNYLKERKNIRIYFDDGYKSALTILPSIVPTELVSKTIIPVIAEKINESGYLTSSDIKDLVKLGFRIVSHGYSHAAMAIYDDTDIYIDDSLQGGKYQNSPIGKDRPLSTYEILYQYIESKKILEDICEYVVDEFVFPYGLYNKTCIDVNQEHNIYKYLSTCDSEIDTGKTLRPRHLIYCKKTIREILDEIESLRAY